MGINMEKRILDTALGTATAATYKRNGTSAAAYLTSGAYINSQANTLVDYTDVENAWLLLDAMTDPNTGEPIVVRPDTIIVPSALVMTALRILHATEVQAVDNQANAATFRFSAPNPLPGRLGQITVLSNQYVRNRTGNSTTWFFGDFKRALLYRQVWATEMLEAADNNDAKFSRDVWQRFKVSEMGGIGWQEPRACTKNT
jgi:hypothetical protein